MENEITIIQNLNELLQMTENAINGHEFNYETFLIFAVDTLSDAELSGKFNGIEGYAGKAEDLYNDYATGCALYESWHTDFVEFVEDLNGVLAEKLNDK